jgi:hypothetical protein
MATTYTLIDKTTLTGTQSSIEFLSIPNTFTDLKVVFSARGNQGAIYNGWTLILNNDTGAYYSYKTLQGSGSSASSYGATGQSNAYAGNADGNTATANTFANTEIYIPNYLSTNPKSASSDSVLENNATTAYMEMSAILYSPASNVAITRLKIAAEGSNSWLSGSSFYLYGIKNS